MSFVTPLFNIDQTEKHKFYSFDADDKGDITGFSFQNAVGDIQSTEIGKKNKDRIRLYKLADGQSWWLGSDGKIEKDF